MLIFFLIKVIYFFNHPSLIRPLDIQDYPNFRLFIYWTSLLTLIQREDLFQMMKSNAFPWHVDLVGEG